MLLFTFVFLLFKRGRSKMRAVVVLVISMHIAFTSGCALSHSFSEFNAMQSAFNFKSFSIAPSIDYCRGIEAEAISIFVRHKRGNP